MLTSQALPGGRFSLGTVFGQLLRDVRESKGLSAYRVAQLTGIPQTNLSGIELGRRRASDANLDALATVSQLGLSRAKLEAWRKLDEMGEAGIELVKREAIDVFHSVMPGVAGADFPPTDDEMHAISEARKLGVWTTDIDNPDLWSVQLSDPRRVGIFVYLQEMIELARAHRRNA